MGTDDTRLRVPIPSTLDAIMESNKTLDALRTAVVGTGYLGRFHAQKYRDLDGSHLIAIADVDGARAAEVAKEVGAYSVTDHRDLIGKVDAVSVASPTLTHFDVAKDLLEGGVHVLVEKPMTSTVEQAQTLIEIAKSNNVVLQVGHLERFNPALVAVEKEIQNPRFIESHRLAPFNKRGSDVNVVLDLMIHDIDIISHLVKSEVKDLKASAIMVISEDGADIANVRLEFKNGCVANVTASRVSAKRERRMRIFQKESYVAIDFQENNARVCRVDKTKQSDDGMPVIDCDDFDHEGGDAIRDEIDAFLYAIRSGTEPLVTGEDGLNAIRTAMQIEEQWILTTAS